MGVNASSRDVFTWFVYDRSCDDDDVGGYVYSELCSEDHKDDEDY